MDVGVIAAEVDRYVDRLIECLGVIHNVSEVNYFFLHDFDIFTFWENKVVNSMVMKNKLQ